MGKSRHYSTSGNGHTSIACRLAILFMTSSIKSAHIECKFWQYRNRNSSTTVCHNLWPISEPGLQTYTHTQRHKPMGIRKITFRIENVIETSKHISQLIKVYCTVNGRRKEEGKKSNGTMTCAHGLRPVYFIRDIHHEQAQMKRIFIHVICSYEFKRW